MTRSPRAVNESRRAAASPAPLRSKSPESRETNGQEPALPHLLIRASAGSGKTFQLSNRYLQLLHRSNPERILASTFTRKAAGEILDRILLRLARAAQDTAALRDLQMHAELPGLRTDECLEMLSRVTRNLHRLRISTLDAFFSKLAGSFALELGLPPGWRILSDQEVSFLKTEALEQVVRHGTLEDTLQLMRLLDRGRSTISISTLIHNAVQNFYALSLQAGPDSWSRFPDCRQLSSEERDGLVERLRRVAISDKRMCTARDKDCERIAAEAWGQVQSSGLLPKVILDGRFHGKEIPEAATVLYQQVAEHIRALLIDEWRSQNEATRRLLHEYHERFSALKAQARGVEFADLSRGLAAAIRDGGVGDASHRLDAGVDHLLLDEFQDTSFEQWSVLQPFAQSVCQPGDHSFFCVGDVKQAIYGWRGGEAAIFDSIETQLPGLQSQPLSHSFRSSPVIMDAVNQIMRGLSKHDNLEEFSTLLRDWSARFPEHTTARTELSGFVRAVVAPIEQQEDGDRMSVSVQREQLWPYVATYVSQLAAEAPAATIGVLTRTNGTVGRLAFELQRLGLDASEEGGSPLTDSAAVTLVLSLLRLADHPGHTIARYHIATSCLAAWLQFEDFTNDAAAQALSQRLREQFSASGYGEFCQSLSTALSPSCNAREWRRIEQLCELADAFDDQGGSPRPGAFADFVMQERRAEPSTARIRVMNVHQAKGLEFDIVVLAELDNALTQTPSAWRWTRSPGAAPELLAVPRSKEILALVGGRLVDAHAQTLQRAVTESLCLLYVALTRAVHSLHLILLPVTNQKTPKTYAGLIRAAVTNGAPLTPGAELWRLRDANWARHYQPSPSPNPAPVLVPRRPEQLNLQPATGRLPRKRHSPSKHSARGGVPLQRALSTSVSSSLTRGRALHACLEQLEWIEDLDFQADALRALVQSTVGGANAEFVERILQDLRRNPLKDVLSRERYSAPRLPTIVGGLASTTYSLRVRRELPFAVQTERGILTGAMDRVVFLCENERPFAAEVLDFKTDQISADEAPRRLEVHRPQLEAYRQSLTALYRLPSERVWANVVFTEPGIVLPLADASDRRRP